MNSQIAKKLIKRKHHRRDSHLNSSGLLLLLLLLLLQLTVFFTGTASYQHPIDATLAVENERAHERANK